MKSAIQKPRPTRDRRLDDMTQPRASALLKGTWKDFSMDMLLTLATRAGLKPELHLAASEKRRAA